MEILEVQKMSINERYMHTQRLSGLLLPIIAMLVIVFAMTFTLSVETAYASDEAENF